MMYHGWAVHGNETKYYYRDKKMKILKGKSNAELCKFSYHFNHKTGWLK